MHLAIMNYCGNCGTALGDPIHDGTHYNGCDRRKSVTSVDHLVNVYSVPVTLKPIPDF